MQELVDLERAAPAKRALGLVERGLGGLGLPAGVAEQLMAVLTCAAAHGPAEGGVVVPGVGEIGDAALLEGAQAARGVQGFVDGVVLALSRTLAERAARELLGRKGVSGPEELSRTAREAWRAKTKSVVAHELSTLTGHGIQACHDRVGLALAPRQGVQAAQSALCRGVSDWRAVAEFWGRCRRLEPEQAGRVCDAVFGPLLAHLAPEDDPPTRR